MAGKEGAATVSSAGQAAQDISAGGMAICGNVFCLLVQMETPHYCSYCLTPKCNITTPTCALWGRRRAAKQAPPLRRAGVACKCQQGEARARFGF